MHRAVEVEDSVLVKSENVRRLRERLSFRCISTVASGAVSMKSCSSSDCRFQNVSIVGISRRTAMKVGENA